MFFFEALDYSIGKPKRTTSKGLDNGVIRIGRHVNFDFCPSNVSVSELGSLSWSHRFVAYMANGLSGLDYIAEVTEEGTKCGKLSVDQKAQAQAPGNYNRPDESIMHWSGSFRWY